LQTGTLLVIEKKLRAVESYPTGWRGNFEASFVRFTPPGYRLAGHTFGR
jgi:hypothetical protein